MGNCLGIGSTEGESSSRQQTLHQNVVHEQQNRDPFSKYQVVGGPLGEGSIGAVVPVQVKESEKGGSAYNSEQDRGCFGFLFKKKNRPEESKDGKNKSNHNDQEYAMKSIQLRRITPVYLEELRNEIEILKELDHPNIVKAYETFENRNNIYLILELCSGGDLYARKPYSEKQAATIIGKILSAIKYMHDRNIIHRDLKFENIMFENNSADAEIKVIDFGLSAKFAPEKPYLREGVGTIYTMAPQVLQGVYTTQADLWSVGVISYILLSNQKPFYHKRRRRVIDKIMTCNYNFHGSAWKHISDEAKDFVSSLIKLDPKERLNATEALEHPWLNKEFALSDREPAIDLMKDVENNLATFSNNAELKKLALVLVAHKSTPEELAGLRKAFDQYDSSNDGIITYEEFKEALETSGYSDEEIKKTFESLDINENGHIMYTEFLAATIEVRGNIEEERLADAFDRIDSDNTGYISRENLMDLLGTNCTPEKLDKLVKEADKNKDGKIGFDEFLLIFREDNRQYMTKVAHLSTMTDEDSESNLVGIDAVIPGGKFDTANGAKPQSEASKAHDRKIKKLSRDAQMTAVASYGAVF